MLGTKDNSNLDKIFKDKTLKNKDKDKLVQGIINMYNALGHEKFYTAIKISMDAFDSKKKKGKEVSSKDIKEILEGAIKISNEIHSE